MARSNAQGELTTLRERLARAQEQAEDLQCELDALRAERDRWSEAAERDREIQELRGQLRQTQSELQVREHLEMS